MQMSQHIKDENSIKAKQYEKKIQRRKLNNSSEYETSRLAFGISFIAFIIMAFLGINFKDKTMNLTILSVASVFLAEGIFNYIIAMFIKKQILENKKISRILRYFGYLDLLMVLNGNIFAFIAGFTLIKEEKTLEYTLSIYMILNSVCVILVSMFNLFKEYVSDTFMIGMYLFLGVTVIHIISTIMISKYVTKKSASKKIIPTVCLLILTSVTGNVFALFIAVIIISKLKNKDEDIQSEWIDILRRLFKNNMAILGLFIIVFLLSLSVCSSLTFEYSIAIENNYDALLISPSLEYPFGTDNFGRCVFTRIVYGARISLIVGILSTALPIIAGGILGSVSGYYGGRIDNGVMRVLDVLFAVPGILLAIAIIAAYGANTVNLILALSISSIPIYARTIRATVMSLADLEFVEAAKASGARDSIIILKHIIPNSLAPIIVRATMSIGAAVLATSSMSYLGLGVEPHIPEWGNILKAGSAYLETNPYLAIFPGLAIILIVLAFNFFGDGLRDATDPKLK